MLLRAAEARQEAQRMPSNLPNSSEEAGLLSPTRSLRSSTSAGSFAFLDAPGDSWHRYITLARPSVPSRKMPKPTPDYSLYYVTGRSLLPTPPNSYTGHVGDYYLSHLEEALKGGVTVVQVREKDVDGKEFLEVAKRVKEVCDKYDVPLFINDRVDIALALRCHCHVGQTDLPARLVRQLLGPDALIGVSVNTPEEMQVVMDEGVVDYVGVGPCFGTQTKKNLNPILGPRGARAVLETLGESKIKAVIIGGITPSTIPNVLAQTRAPLPSGGYRSLDGLAVVSAIAASTEPESAARELREMFERKPTYPLRSPNAEALSAEQVVEEAVELLRILKDGKKTPLVHHITNFVVMNDTANLTLAFGASPIMSASPDEAPHLSKLISCLLLNLGTITEAQLNAQKIAGAAANRNGKPVVFDPVGVGATEYRKKSASDLLNICHVSIIKGNAGEIGALAGLSEVKARGVDSVGKGFKDPATVVKTLAAREKLIVAMSGETDYISDGSVCFTIKNGTFWQEKITGSGCMASAAVALFAGLEHESGPLVAAVAGLLAINVAAEIAAGRPEVNGPNTFRAALIDACYNLRVEDVRSRAKVQRI
ncbi:thiamine-phosphate diphosphorylase / hydroxyethylthiazole kinase [Rhodotorula toruloides]|uniref:Thiamine-phosphate diphosphorylase / hydroxyethylthiazole kinase n=1 Tax=Rhodotorula toruloides TaxID=5286 RepID=A0A511KHK0_RHOTO|nr:thiamine-phosphate diphosphorylase / hydroxyethylthiazole kinase [Rhodotorula toruloides]